MDTPEPPETLFALHLSKGRRVGKFIVTEDRLVEDISIGKRRWLRSWQLRDLSPDLEYTSARPENTEVSIVAGLVVIGLAVSFYFSTLYTHMPLLAPLVGVFGAWLLAKGLKDWRIETWTLIRKVDGSAATYITHSFCKPEDRREFEVRLVEKIRSRSEDRFSP